jgi:hypothetical protein
LKGTRGTRQDSSAATPIVTTDRRSRTHQTCYSLSTNRNSVATVRRQPHPKPVLGPLILPRNGSLSSAQPDWVVPLLACPAVQTTGRDHRVAGQLVAGSQCDRKPP